jgi:hypothetical protein
MALLGVKNITYRKYSGARCLCHAADLTRDNSPGPFLDTEVEEDNDSSQKARMIWSPRLLARLLSYQRVVAYSV